MPDDTDGERLVVLLEARISDFEKQLKKASGTVTTEYGKMRKGSAEATKQLETDMSRATSRINAMLVSTGSRMNDFGRNFAAGAVAPVAGLLTLTAAVAGTMAALEKFGNIADKSAAAGVDSEFFQGIAYQAKLSGVEIDTVAGALATFAKNSGLAAEGKGRMVAALQALNPELLKNIQLATTQEQRIKLVADAMAHATNQAQAAAIASAAFGDSGAQLVAAFSDGADGIDRMLAKAKEMGIVVDRDVISRADELGDKFDTVAWIIDNKLKKALVDLGPTILWLEDRVGDLADLIGQVIDLKNNPGEIVDVLAGSTGPADRLLKLIRDIRTELDAAKMDAALGIGDQTGGIREAMMGAGSSKANDIGAGPLQRDLEKWFNVRLKPQVDTSEIEHAQGELEDLAGQARNLNNSTIQINVTADTKAAADAIAKITSLAPELRTPQQQAKDALNTALGSSPDAIMRAAAVTAYNKTLAALDEADRRSVAKGAGKALASKSKELSDAYQRIITSANTRIGQSAVEAQALGLPQEAADRLRYTYDLLSQAEGEGIKLDPKKRAELTALAAEMAHADAVTRKYTDAWDEQKKAIDSVADAFAGLFSKPWTSWTDMVDNLLGSFASIGQSNLKDGITSLLTGSFGKPANDNGGNPLAAGLGAIGGALPVNLKNPKDITEGFAGLFKNNPALGQGLGVAAGAIGIGYQSANPIMGGIGGALSGLATGNPIMAVAGGVTGRICSIKEIRT